MTIGELIYTILIGPLELLFEIIFVIADRHVSNPTYAIIVLSLAMNFLVLPLYRRADAVQAEERDRENKLAPWIKHIKKTFRGDERFMMLQAYYKENNYKPTDSLKGSISLLLEIPFFIAAYHFLSNLQALRGISFGPIVDLGVPDALITISGININILPILMTVINVISAAIYMKGFPLKSKVQMYGIAAIFLVFLYKSPAGLVFYWTLNNLFSLIKNLVYKLENPRKVLTISGSIIVASLFALVLLVHPMNSVRAQVFILTILLSIQLLIIAQSKISAKNLGSITTGDFKAKTLFYLSATILTVLVGILIPSSVITDSTEEFISLTSYYSPFWYIAKATAISIGTFFVWGGIFFNLTSKEGKPAFSLLITIAAISSVINYMFFGKGYGNISNMLVYDNPINTSLKSMIINGAILVMTACLIYLLLAKKSKLIMSAAIAMSLTLVIMAGMNVVQIARNLEQSSPALEAARESEPEIRLSKNGKNVIVVMMDRQIGHFVPFIMHEKPELKKNFDGFTYYSNSFSFGNFTNVGCPALYGGYDYTPSEMNQRKDEKLVDKHNEALKVMPKYFLNQGYEVTVLDPPYAGYGWIPDLSIYDDMPQVNRGITNGKYSLQEYHYESNDDETKRILKRNFFLYGIFRSSPIFAQGTLYSDGGYNTSVKNSEGVQEIKSLTEATGMNNLFMSQYAALCHLNDITKVDNSETDTFTMMSNNLTHEPTLLQEPNFEPAEIVNNEDKENYLSRTDDDGKILNTDNEAVLTHYQVNVAAMIKIGEWFEYLKENEAYDNTRIIIVSDHGRDIKDNISPQVQFNSEKDGEKLFDTCFYNSVLLVKDFNATGFNVSDDLSSNADTAYLATRGLRGNGQNLFTGNRFRQLSEIEDKPKIIYTFDHQTDKNNGNVFLPANWFTVEKNIYDKKNWKYIGYH